MLVKRPLTGVDLGVVNRARRWRRRPKAPQRGAVLVEAAIVMPLLLLLLFGIVEYGLLFRTALTVSESTRSAARVGVAQPRVNGYHLSAAAAASGSLKAAGVNSNQIGVMVLYKADPATGGLAGLGAGGTSDAAIESCATDCWVFDWDTSSGQYVPRSTPTWPHTAQSACGPEGQTDYLGVHVRARHDFFTGIFRGSQPVTERTIMRLEPIATLIDCRP